MIFRYQDNCKICAHYQGEKRCQAFPFGIPALLWSGENPHREPYPGDQGYRFQGKPLDAPPPLDEDELNEFEGDNQRLAA